MKRIIELPRPGERPAPRLAVNIDQLVPELAEAVAREIHVLGDTLPADVAFKVNMLVGLAAGREERRGERLREALSLLRAVPR